MSFLKLAEAIASRQPHAVKGGHAQMPHTDRNPVLPAKRPSRAKNRQITRPGNNAKSGRAFMESPSRPPLSEAP